MLAMDSKDQLYHPLTSRESSGNLFGFSVPEKMPLEIKNTDSMKLLPRTEQLAGKTDPKKGIKADGKKGVVETPAFGSGKDRGFFKDYNDVSSFSIQSKK